MTLLIGKAVPSWMRPQVRPHVGVQVLKRFPDAARNIEDALKVAGECIRDGRALKYEDVQNYFVNRISRSERFFVFSPRLMAIFYLREEEGGFIMAHTVVNAILKDEYAELMEHRT